MSPSCSQVCWGSKVTKEHAPCARPCVPSPDHSPGLAADGGPRHAPGALPSRRTGFRSCRGGARPGAVRGQPPRVGVTTWAGRTQGPHGSGVRAGWQSEAGTGSSPCPLHLHLGLCPGDPSLPPPLRPWGHSVPAGSEFGVYFPGRPSRAVNLDKAACFPMYLMTLWVGGPGSPSGPDSVSA